MKGFNMESRIDCLSTLCRALLKGNELTEETEGLLHQFVTMCIAENNSYRNYIHGSFIYLHKFYLKLYESFPIGEESILVQENIVLCHKRLLEFESCHDGSVRYIKASQEIKPYFEKNARITLLYIWTTRINKWDWDFTIHIDEIRAVVLSTVTIELIM